ncbi:alpha-L-fucosidase [Niastella koreensis]|uniref:alpha-L-fucosidase n=2 Tax=Niastella koreensis TaxID=354356 RepID=G8TKW3_NIAKG|nr:alpha-L-fucosidase [Niastella koreensis]AEV99792.1 glycoside hydrolase family 29 (alpha-L-fucosidase) [Niastella koreensis GR20-10]OQP51586.1 alpha-L-fucosidase [Niastella koreensis]
MKQLLTVIIFLACNILHAQIEYVPPKDPLVIKKLAEWQDQKFGLFMHWGPYSQWGVVESWSICPDDWVTRTGTYANNYFEYKKAYENLSTTFNPVAFNPEKWVKAAKAAGMRYVVFTTKHHDGFCMFDTKQTDYKITGSQTPFSHNPNSNVTKVIFDAFRAAGFMTGAYFSKPDWHSENFWWPYFPPKDHNVNYSTIKYPDRWKKFQDFTYNQIEELMTGYGPIDILWLDGGWVRPSQKENDPLNMDINMRRIATMANKLQPGLIMVDRTVPGEYENYSTPEQEVPEKPLTYPWETCMTMGNSWSYSKNDQYKSAHHILELLVKIVSRGGNLLLNVGPDGNGDWDPVVYQRLQEIGAWMAINGECIYASRPVAPYSTNNLYYTQSKDGNKIYACWLSEKETVELPTVIQIPVNKPGKPKRVTLLAAPEQKLKWTYASNLVTVQVPVKWQHKSGLKYSAVFKLE